MSPRPRFLLASLVALCAWFPLAALAQDAAAPAAVADDPLLKLVSLIVDMVRAGQWGQAAALLVIIGVLALRTYGQKAYQQLPETVGPPLAWLRDLLGFFVTTKPGGWLLNMAGTAAATLGGSALAHIPLTAAMVSTVVFGAAAAAGFYGGIKDFMEWRQKRASAAAVKAGETAGAAAAVVAVATADTATGAAAEIDALRKKS